MSNQSRDARYARAFAAVALGSPSLGPSDRDAARSGRAVVAASPALAGHALEYDGIEILAMKLGERLRELRDEREACPDDVASGWGAG